VSLKQAAAFRVLYVTVVDSLSLPRICVYRLVSCFIVKFVCVGE